jgi:hypothetical protein
VTAITERNRAATLSSNVPQLQGRTGEIMSLGAIAFTGLIAAIIIVVVAITLINKYAQ